ncbi:MAG: cell division protein FtsZ, partial [Limnohabitans sp.]
MSSLQNSLAIVGVVTLVGVVLYNLWTARQNAPRQAAPETTPSVDPVLDNSDLSRSGSNESAYLDDEIGILPTPEKKPPLDALIDVIAAIEVDVQVSGDAALAALPATRRVGTKPFAVEGLNDNTGEWE